MIVRIIAGAPVRYSLDNGFTQMEYEPGQLYNVPDFVADGMFRRGWATAETAPPKAEVAQPVPEGPEPAPAAQSPSAQPTQHEPATETGARRRGRPPNPPAGEEPQR